MIYYHKKGRWIYFGILSWQPFSFLMNSGWIHLSFKWFKRFLWTIPKQRGWKWN